MKICLPVITVVSMASAITGCASAPPAATTKASPAAAAAAPAPKATAVPMTAEDTATLNAARGLGYVPRNHNGTIVYCRSESQIGTRMQSTTCISEEQVAAAVQRSVGNRASVEAMQKKSLLQPQGN